MSATPVATSQARPQNAGALDQPVRPHRRGKLRAASRAERHERPRARPLLPVPAPTRLAASGSAARGCTLLAGRLTTATALASARWRLTDRGITVILVVSVLIVLAAVTVVGLTALHVTSEGYRPAPASQLVGR